MSKKTKTRTKLPKSIAEEVMFRSAMRCCVCQERGDQIHHIDGDPRNNRLENLVFLCYRDHNESSIKGSLQRKMTPELLKKFRNDWYEKVKVDRRPKTVELPLNGGERERFDFQVVTDALICLEVQKLRWRSSPHNWDEAEEVIAQLRMFARVAGIRARDTILELLEEAASRTRFHMPQDIAGLIGQVTFDFLPIDTFRQKATPPLSKAEVDLLLWGPRIANGLIYDGAVKLRNLSIVFEGAELLWHVHHFAVVNELHPVIKDIQEKYDWLFSTLNRPGLEDAVRLIRFFYDHAVRGDSEYPLIPDDLDVKILKAKTTNRRG